MVLTEAPVRAALSTSRSRTVKGLAPRTRGLGGQGGVNRCSAVMHRADGLGQLLGRGVFDHKSTRAGSHGSLQISGPAERGEDQHRNIRVERLANEIGRAHV